MKEFFVYASSPTVTNNACDDKSSIFFCSAIGLLNIQDTGCQRSVILVARKTEDIFVEVLMQAFGAGGYRK